MTTIDPRHVAGFSLPNMSTTALRLHLSSIPEDIGVRSAFASVLEPCLERVAPECLDDYRALRALLPTYGPFSFMPIRQLALLTAYAGHLSFPELALEDASNTMIERCHTLMGSIPVVRPMLSACNGDFGEFAAYMTRSQRFFYSSGEVTCHRTSPTSVELVFDDLPVAALRVFLGGFWRALLHYLELEGEVAVEDETPMRLVCRVTWSS